MQSVIYKPADVLHWFERSSKESRQRAKKQGQALFEGTSDLGLGIKRAASAAAELGRGAMSDLAQWRAEVRSFVLGPDGFESISMTGRRRVAYSEVVQIKAHAGDRFEVVSRQGSIAIRPVAHLVAGSARVAVGWQRNGLEVPYMTLVEELAARCGVEIVEE